MRFFTTGAPSRAGQDRAPSGRPAASSSTKLPSQAKRLDPVSSFNESKFGRF
jgi:hypothetical protein